MFIWITQKLPSDLKVRVLSAILLFAIAVVVIMIGGFFYDFTVLSLAVISTQELFAMVEKLGLSQKDFESAKKMSYSAIIIPFGSLIAIRNYGQAGDHIVFWFVFLIAAVDIGAYFFGKTMGQIKLAPTISPNKTVEGLLGGMMCGLLLSLGLFYLFKSKTNILYFLFLSVFLSALSQLGDLAESWLKRKAGVKDSGTIIPGHGGLLDRIDGYLFTAPCLLFFIILGDMLFSVKLF